MKSWLNGLGALSAIGVLALGVAFVIGWVLNIIALIGMVGGPVTTLFIVRIVGIFVAPLGSIMGWFF